MDNQHKKIKGYRELSQAEIDLMNEIKSKGVGLGELVQKLRDSLAITYDITDPYKYEGMTDDQVAEGLESSRWINMGKDHLQQGLMCLTRSVAKPEFF